FILTDDHFSRAEPFYTKIFLGTEFEARKHNYYILLTTTEKNFSKKSIPRFLLEKNVDGVILAGKVPFGLIDYIQELDLPLILIDFLPHKGKVSAILMDNLEGAMQAVRHLIDTGHRWIAFIGGDMSHPSIRERFEGYQKALEEAGLPFDERLVVTDEPYPASEEGYHATRQLLERKVPFTAVFAANDAMAIGCMRCLREHHLQIPQDVALVGFDDVEVATQVEPHLTTVRVDKEEMGALAVRQIVEMIQNPKKVYGNFRVPVELIVRQSTLQINLNDRSGDSSRTGNAAGHSSQ
ncbi:MAG: substrate-binding domain-containing protein, partial [candidate division KSB1 bacterium]|nr:substrate-binding domain-containing protein [candidate division KSB1 bacterium]